jgi:hypothetical protein
MLLTRIDELVRHEHWHLQPEDECFAIREYIARGGYQAGETNRLIFNLKKSPDRRGLQDWHYKESAINRFGRELREAFLSGGGGPWLNGSTLVPIPPSKAKTDPTYDDRMVRVAGVLAEGTGAEVRELIIQKSSTDAHHLQDRSREVDALVENYEVDQRLCSAAPARIAVIDDVLTTGAHFRAVKIVLLRCFPSAHVIGLFIARRAVTAENLLDDWPSIPL